MIFPTETEDWFTLSLRGSSRNGKPFSYGEFLHTLEAQIHRKIDKQTGGYCFNKQYYLQDIKMSLDRNVFEDLSARFNVNNTLPVPDSNKFFPLFTFHGTQNVSKVQSILKYGYLIPGMNHPTFGWHLTMQCGNIYGDGVYSSPNFDTASWYSFLDQHEAVQLIVNLVFVGKYKTVIPEEPFKPGEDTPHTIPSHFQDRYQDKLDTYDTLLTKDMSIVVSGNVEHIIPIAVITMSPNISENSHMKSYLMNPRTSSLIAWKDLLTYYKCPDVKKKNSHEKDDDDDDEDRDLSPPGVVEMINLFGEYHIADFTNCVSTTLSQSPMTRTKAKHHPKKLKHWICIPTSVIAHSTAVSGIASLAQPMQDFLLSLHLEDKKTILCYDEIVHSKHITTPSQHQGIGDFFSSLHFPMSHNNKQQQERVIPCILEVFEGILKGYAKEIIDSFSAPTIHMMYLFIATPQDLASLDKVYEYLISQQPLIVKIIFLKGYYQEIANLKARYQNVFLFEEYSHVCKMNGATMKTNTSFTEIIDILLDEEQNIPHIRHYTYQVPYPLGVIGQGFFASLDSSPVWDVISQGQVILFKGSVPTVKVISSSQHAHDNNATTYFKTIFIDKKAKEKSSDASSIYHRQLYQDYSDCVFSLEQLRERETSFHDKTAQAQREKHNQRVHRKEAKLVALMCKMEDYDDIHKFASMIIPLLAKFRNYLYAHPERFYRHEQMIWYLGESMMRVVNDYPLPHPVAKKQEKKQGEQGEESLKTVAAAFSLEEEVEARKRNEKFNTDRWLTHDVRVIFESMFPSIGLRKTLRYQLQKLLSDMMTIVKVKQFSIASFARKTLHTDGSIIVSGNDWLQKLLQMKFHKRLIKRIQSDTTATSTTVSTRSIHAPSPQNCEVVDLFDSFSIKNIQKVLIATVPNGYNTFYSHSLQDILDAFTYVSTRKGLLIRTRQSTAASEIEPWNIIIEYLVSSVLEKSDITTMVAANECGLTIRDSHGSVVNNLLLDYDPTTAQDILTKMYYAYVYTRIPYCFLPTQPMVLVINTWISSLEKLFKVIFVKRLQFQKSLVSKQNVVKHHVQPPPEDNDEHSLEKEDAFVASISKEEYAKYTDMVSLSLHLFARVQAMVRKHAEMTRLRRNILQSNTTDHPVELYLTTKNSIISLNKVLAALTISDEDENDVENEQEETTAHTNTDMDAVNNNDIDDETTGARRSNSNNRKANVLQDKTYYHSDAWHRLAFSLLGEASIRTAIARIRGSKNGSTTTDSGGDALIFELLQLHPSTDLSVYSFNAKYNKAMMLSAVNTTNRFFFRQYTNCSLFTIVSVLGFLERIHTSTFSSETSTFPVDRILQAYLSNHEISTGTFLATHMTGYKPRETQLALYLYGMKYATYTKPESVYFENPRRMKESIVEEYVSKMNARQLAIASVATKRKDRWLQRLITAEPYKLHHGTPPTVFTLEDVRVLNETRSTDDQLVCLENGLLQNHCCYPDCPMYLQALPLPSSYSSTLTTTSSASSHSQYHPKHIQAKHMKQKKTLETAMGTRSVVEQRIALRYHLALDVWIDNYLPNFHANARGLVRWSHSYEEFVEKMNQCFVKDTRYTNLLNKESHLQAVWKGYK